MKTRLALLIFLLPLMAAAQSMYVGTLVYSNPESHQKMNFAITGGNTLKYFTINPATGAITVKTSAFETFKRQKTFKLTVKVTDDGKMQRADGTLVKGKALSTRATVTVVLRRNVKSGNVVLTSYMTYQT